MVASSFKSMTKGHANGLLFDSHVLHTQAEDLYRENSPISSDKSRVSAKCTLLVKCFWPAELKTCWLSRKTQTCARIYGERREHR